MTDVFVNIEIDGKPLQARKGAMLIEIADANGIYIPRFCYHKKLSVAANCRMCLIEIEKAPKPLPACATPVMEGMKAYTRSALALDSQKAVMEFLLINHPLDCPICDQGGECELQDLAVGYGRDVSRYQEKKRVVKDKDIGPLVQTDMTRCIHCTRCVRFGEEIAGLRELGATGRSEHMEIGTYVEKSMVSELSGNVIDLCPVGALTSKPFRFSARAWEMVQRDTIAPHDSIGSNLRVHIEGNRIKRVVPGENEAINEVWISDRDRFSYEGLYSAERLTVPIVKQDDKWKEVDWDTALGYVRDSLRQVIKCHGADKVGALASPASTLEELYLLQKLMRELGCHNVDHRLRQCDVSDQEYAPLFPWLGQSIADLEYLDAALLVGSHVRKEQPIANHRLRKASMRGAAIMLVNPLDYELNYRVAEKVIAPPSKLPMALAGIANALLGRTDGSVDAGLRQLLAGVEVNTPQRAIAETLKERKPGAVLLGNLATAHREAATLRALAGAVAELSGSRLGYLSEAANSAGAWLAGVLPHRGPGGKALANPGQSAHTMLAEGLKGYVLMGVEPELDCWDGRASLKALDAAAFVVSLTAFRTPPMDRYADVLLPIGLFAESSGTYVNTEGVWQSFAGVISPPGEARPAWKVLRVLGNHFGLADFEYGASSEVREELKVIIGELTPCNHGKWRLPDHLRPGLNGMERISEVPMNALDPLVRRAAALQQTQDVADGAAHVNASTARSLGLTAGVQIRLQQDEGSATLLIAIDDRVPDHCVLVHGAQGVSAELGPWEGPVTVQRH
ncbi:MAG: NADH-quinone oxidoreductase subunit NuoG [Gammaproteobacteria bacterium]|nr:NADH-quinone oxidoreductase subunit NuoG [Gammaproteobacteria bacterium]MCI0590439.1 NADH-quinone oxidoreductase subunit NuoG [Gammaproteobacteria bacterium]